jgi:hypothetical protein
MSEFIEEAEYRGEGWELIRRRQIEAQRQSFNDRMFSNKWNDRPGGSAGEM